jgi:hypothetical protein
VNFNVYIDDRTADELKKVARKTGMSRNALVRKAIAAYLDRGGMEWPSIVTSYEGDGTVQPFEAARNELTKHGDDPFATPRPSRSERRKKRKS